MAISLERALTIPSWNGRSSCPTPRRRRSRRQPNDVKKRRDSLLLVVGVRIWSLRHDDWRRRPTERKQSTQRASPRIRSGVRQAEHLPRRGEGRGLSAGRSIQRQEHDPERLDCGCVWNTTTAPAVPSHRRARLDRLGTVRYRGQGEYRLERSTGQTWMVATRSRDVEGSSGFSISACRVSRDAGAAVVRPGQSQE